MDDNKQGASDAGGHDGPLTFGLDIGIASVGWAVLSDRRIVDLGVRAFDKAETPDKGESLNLQRRTARLLRRRLWRRAWRLTKLSRLLTRHGVVESPELFKSQPSFTDSTWSLRVAALDRRLTPTEWARVLYHLCKHRGFHWISRAEERKADDDAKGEGGRVKAGLAHTKALMEQQHYRTVAEMVLAEFPEAQRNKQGDYSKALSRVLLDHELGKLFEAQRRHGNPHAVSALEEAVRGKGDRRSGLFWSQKPALAGKDLLKMLGHCTFEASEHRAPKASFTAERHVWLTRLNNLRVIVDGASRPLNQGERSLAMLLPYQAGEKFTYKTLRKAVVKAGLLPDSFRYGGLSYPSAKQKEEDKAKDPEEQTLVKLSGWHEIRLALRKDGLESEWLQLAAAALGGEPEQLDAIAWVLSVFKDDEEVQVELAKLGLPGGQKLIDTLLAIRFDKFHSLSLKALRRIVPFMEQGLRYDEAVSRIPEYGHHSQRFVVGAGIHKFLPPFYEGRDKTGRMKFRDDLDLPRNPVVLRALNQARKVVNALINEYGSPTLVHIEMARDLSRPLDERREIEKLQKEYRDRNDKAREQFTADFGRLPSGAEFEKWLLYREQHGKCGYSLEALDLERVINDRNYVQVDHALPYSRSYDDSKNNKVLALTKINQDKGNRTPYEFLDGASNSDRWRNFVAWVEGNKSYRQAKRSRLLRKNYGKDEASAFKDRNLNDTRYICRFFKNYVEQYLQLAGDGDSRRCVVVNGQLTAFLRARWGLLKIREESDRHHALDAVVVAACSHSMVKRLADYARHRELEHLRGGFPDPETGEIINPVAYQKLVEHFPDPWQHFRRELEVRLKTDDLALLREELLRIGNVPAHAIDFIRPLFVSRAPMRRSSGVVHEGTIRSAKLLEKGRSFVSVPLQKLKLGDLEKILGADDQRNTSLIDGLRARLKAHDGDGKKAFAEPFYRPSRPGSRAPLVRTVKIVSSQSVGMHVRGGVADLGPMHHVDIYAVNSKFIAAPAYAAPLECRLNQQSLPADARFLFSLTKNDYVKVMFGDASHAGYFVMYESDGRLTLRAHDQPKPNKDYFRKGISSATSIEKFHVDVLGRLYRAPLESRDGLA